MNMRSSTIPSKKQQEMDATEVCIDQIKKSVRVELRAAPNTRGTRSSVELSGQRDFGFEEDVTAEYTKYIILLLYYGYK